MELIWVRDRLRENTILGHPQEVENRKIKVDASEKGVITMALLHFTTQRPSQPHIENRNKSFVMIWLQNRFGTSQEHASTI